MINDFPTTTTAARESERKTMPLAVFLKKWPRYDLRTWKNPTKHDLCFDVVLGHDDSCTPVRGVYIVRIEIAARAELDIPKVWDRAIVHIHDGLIDGGLCPWLVPADAAEWPEHHAALRMGNPIAMGVK